jgi:hypothetical protein
MGKRVEWLCKIFLKRKQRKKESIPEKLLEDQFSESYVTVSGEPKILMSETKSFLSLEKWSPRYRKNK